MNMYTEKNRFNRTAAPVAPRLNGKTVLAIILVTMLVFMWIRVFVNRGKTVDDASAASIENIAAQQQNASKEAVSLVHVELPFEKGRHDVLKHDFFVPKDFYAKDQPAKAETNTNAGNDGISKSQISAIQRHLDVSAIIKSNNSPGYKAFVNGNLLKDGESVSVKVGAKTFDLKVLEIFSSKIIFECDETIISFKMSQLETSN